MSDKEKFESKYSIGDELTVQEAERFLREAPIETENVIERGRFGITGFILRPLFQTDNRLIEDAIKWYLKLKESQDLYEIIDKEERDKPPKKEPIITSKRVLSLSERKYLLDLSRSSNMSKLLTALLMLSLENINFATQAYKSVQRDNEFLESADWGDVTEALKDAGLYPLSDYAPNNEIREELKALSNLDEDSLEKLKNSIPPETPIESIPEHLKEFHEKLKENPQDAQELKKGECSECGGYDYKHSGKNCKGKFLHYSNEIEMRGVAEIIPTKKVKDINRDNKDPDEIDPDNKVVTSTIAQKDSQSIAIQFKEKDLKGEIKDLQEESMKEHAKVLKKNLDAIPESKKELVDKERVIVKKISLE